MMRRILPVIFLVLAALILWLFLQDSEGPGQGPATALEDAQEARSEAPSPEVARPERSSVAAVAVDHDARPVKHGAWTHGLNGLVVDEQRQPVPGAWVAAYSVPFPLLDFEFEVAEIFEKPLDFSLEPLTSTFADDEGRFQLTGAPGRTLFVTARTYRRLTPRRLRVTPDKLDQEEGILLETVAAADLKGSVVDENGAPVANAEVLVGPGIKYLIAAFRNRTFFMERVYTDSSGRFQVEAVPAGITLTANAFRGAVQSGLAEFGPLKPDTTGQPRVQLEDMGALTGRVVSKEEDGVNDATVVAIPIDFRRAIPFVRNPGGWTAVSDASGEFEFRELPIGNYVLLAQARAGRSAPVSATVQAENTLPAEISMDTKAVVEGRVVDGSGAPVGGAVVHLGSIPIGDLAEDGDREEFLQELMRELMPELLPEGTYARADSKGRFKVPAWSKARLRVEAQGFTTHVFDLRDLDEGKQPVLVMQSAGGAAGLVMDSEAAEPVRYYFLNGDLSEPLKKEESASKLEEDEQLLFAGSSWREELRAKQLVDSADGRFRLEGLQPGKWRFEIKAEGYATKTVRDVEVQPGEMTSGVVVNLDRGARVNGQVVTADTGEAVRGALVSVGRGAESGFLSLLQGLGEDTAFGESDETGFFTVSGAREDADHVNVLSDGFAMTSLEIEPLEAFEERQDVVVELLRGGTLQGVVKDRRGVPLPGRMVVAASMQARDFQQTATDGDGFFKIENMRPGSYFMLSTALDDESLFTGDFAAMLGSSRIVTAYVKDGEITKVDIVDESAGGCRVTGRVVRGDEAIPGAQLTAFRPDEGGMMNFNFSTARSDRVGEFVFKSLAPGEYKLNVESRAWSGQLDLVVPDLAEDFVVLEVPRNSVRGQVVSGMTGAPLEDASVNLVPEDAGGGGGGFIFGRRGSNTRASTDEEGRFSFEGLSPGSYHIEVRARSRWSRRDEESGSGEPVLGNHKGEPFTLAFSEAKELPIISLPLAGSLKVIAVSYGGEPLEDWFSLEAKPLGETEGANVEEELRGYGNDGEGWIRGLAPGSYDVVVRANGYSPVELPAAMVRDGEVTELRVTLSKGVELRVRALDSNNRPVNAKFVLRDRDGNQVNDDGGILAAFAMMQRDGDAAVRIGTFASGGYTLEATYEGQTRRMPVSLVEGQNSVVEVRF